MPYVVTVHGADVYQHFRMGGAVERRAKDVLRNADAVMANSSAVAGLLEGVVEPGRLTVVLNGTTGLGALGEPADDYLAGEPLVLTVGYLIERKAIDDLITAVARLRDDGRRVHLAVVGDGRLLHVLEEQAATEGVADNVHFLGRLPHARVLALMARAQLFALPSRDEAFGLVYTEAMAQKTPVLATRGEGPADFIEDDVNGYLVPARDPGAIARRHRAGARRSGPGGRHRRRRPHHRPRAQLAAQRPPDARGVRARARGRRGSDDPASAQARPHRGRMPRRQHAHPHAQDER